MYYTVIKHSDHLRTLDKCRKHSPAARVFYISLVFSNARRVLSQCNTRLRLLYLLTLEVHYRSSPHCSSLVHSTGADPGEVKWVKFHPPPPPPFFSEPSSSFFFFFLHQALVLLHYYKNSPPISKSCIRACSSDHSRPHCYSS